jgi:phosphoribosyl-AMP cyclohydrolase
MTQDALNQLKFDDQGLIPAVIQDAQSGQMLMVAWMNVDSLADTVRTGKTHFWSRSRKKYWMKGESSGHTQEVVSISTDCDRDVLLIRVNQIGGACHTGYRSCFSWHLRDGRWIEEGDRLFDPDDVYKK